MSLPGSLLLASTAVLFVSTACVSRSENRPHPGIAASALWRSFEKLSGERSLAISGDPDRLWVGAAVGAARTQSDADEAALAACRRRRIDARIQNPCRLYANGEEIVWDPFGKRAARRRK